MARKLFASVLALTPRQSVRLAAEKFRQVDTSRFGVVLNDLNPETGSSSCRHYYHDGRYCESTDDDPGDGRARSAGAGRADP